MIRALQVDKFKIWTFEETVKGFFRPSKAYFQAKKIQGFWHYYPQVTQCSSTTQIELDRAEREYLAKQEFTK